MYNFLQNHIIYHNLYLDTLYKVYYEIFKKLITKKFK